MTTLSDLKKSVIKFKQIASFRELRPSPTTFYVNFFGGLCWSFTNTLWEKNRKFQRQPCMLPPQPTDDGLCQKADGLPMAESLSVSGLAHDCWWGTVDGFRLKSPPFGCLERSPPFGCLLLNKKLNVNIGIWYSLHRPQLVQFLQHQSYHWFQDFLRENGSHKK